MQKWKRKFELIQREVLKKKEQIQKTFECFESAFNTVGEKLCEENEKWKILHKQETELNALSKFKHEALRQSVIHLVEAFADTRNWNTKDPGNQTSNK